ncbi:MAG: malectin domain-containing carbohydrate-binding protein [Steroidobacteraceae bacterium]
MYPLTRILKPVIGAVLAIGGLLACAVSWAAPGETTLISAKLAGPASNGNSINPRTSADGRFVVYQSTAHDMVATATYFGREIFVYDNQRHAIETVSVGLLGRAANAESSDASISANGRYVAFSSVATNLVPNDVNYRVDVFVRDLQTGVTELVSVSSTGAQTRPSMPAFMETAISADGRFVAFTSNAFDVVPNVGGQTEVFVRDRLLGTTELVSVDAAGKNRWYRTKSPSISADGRFVAFAASETANATPGGQTSDIFVRDRQAGTTEVIDVDSNGVKLREGFSPFISADGRHVAFASGGGIYVRDRQAATLELVSKSTAGTAGNADSFEASISGDGRYVVFASFASNLVAGDTNGIEDVFLRDRQSGSTVRVNLGPDGEQAVSSGPQFTRATISADGNYVAFNAMDSGIYPGDINSRHDVFVRNRQTTSTVLASFALNDSLAAGSLDESAITPDGRYVAFSSAASTIVADDRNDVADVFVLDRSTGAVERVSVNSDGQEGNSFSHAASISADGRFVAFASYASNFEGGDNGYNPYSYIYVRDRQARTTQRVRADRGSDLPVISADGRYIAFRSFTSLPPNPDPTGGRDIFLYDRQNGSTELISVFPYGDRSGSWPSVSRDGRYVAYTGAGTTYVRDRVAGVTQDVTRSQGGAAPNGRSFDTAISADGRYVAFSSDASNLVPNDANVSSDVFVHDRVTHVTEIVSVDSAGLPVRYSSSGVSLSPDGRYVGFLSNAIDLVAGDTNNALDIFVHDRQTGATRRVSVASDGTQANDDTYGTPALSADAQYITFGSTASNLAPGDRYDGSDVFIHETGFAPAAAIRINAGGDTYVDTQGQTWWADRGFNTGQVSMATGPIDGTADDWLYQSIRWDDASTPELQYDIPVPDGDYEVRLHFVETNSGTAYAGARVFNVDMEDSQRFANVDVFAEAGGLNKALVKSATVTVADGRLTLRFRHKVKNPIVSAIEILSR